MEIAAFNEARLSAQYSTFGEPAVIGGLSCVVCATSHKGKSQLVDGGLGIDFSRQVRARMSDFTAAPKEGAKAVVSGKTYRIAEVGEHFHAGEYLIGLEQMR